MTSGFEGLDDLCLMARGNAAADIHLINDLGKFCLTHLVEFCPAQNFSTGSKDTYLSCNGFGSILVIPGNHDSLQPCLLSDPYGLLYFRSGRVDHSQKSYEGKILLQHI